MCLVSEQTFLDRLALERGVHPKEAEKEPLTQAVRAIPSFGHPPGSDVHSGPAEERIRLTGQRH